MVKYQQYDEYKDSGFDWLGAIPSHWDKQRLKFIFSIEKRIAGKLGFSVLSVTQKGIKVKDTESGDGQLSMDYSKYQRVHVGDFAMNHMDLLTGYIDISKFDGVTSPDYRVFRIKNHKSHDDKYYLYLLQMGYKQKTFFHLGQGSSHLGRWRLPTDAFYGIEYPVPNKVEQAKIADFLDHETAQIDTLIEKQQTLIQLLKEKRQAVISHAVTKGLNPDAPMKNSGVEWLGKVPEHWEVMKGAFIGQLFGSESVPENQVVKEGILPFIKVSTLSRDGFELQEPEWFVSARVAKNYKTRTSYVVFPKRGAAIFTNKVNVVNEPSLIDPNLMGWQINEKALSKYIALLLKTRKLDDIADVSTVPQINNKHINPEKFPLPPIKEQQEILDYIDGRLITFDDLIDKAEQAIQLMQERRTALISAAVTGKIDVRGWVAPDNKAS